MRNSTGSSTGFWSLLLTIIRCRDGWVMVFSFRSNILASLWSKPPVYIMTEIDKKVLCP